MIDIVSAFIEKILIMLIRRKKIKPYLGREIFEKGFYILEKIEVFLRA